MQTGGEPFTACSTYNPDALDIEICFPCGATTVAARSGLQQIPRFWQKRLDGESLHYTIGFVGCSSKVS